MFDTILDAVAKFADKMPIVDAWRSRTKGHRDHDTGKFRELDSILSETALRRFLEDAYAGAIPHAAFEPIHGFLQWAELSSNQFLIKKIQHAMEQFTTQLNALTAFLSVNIFPYGSDSSRLHFRPDQDPDKAGSLSGKDVDFFHQRYSELTQHIAACESSYRRFRKAVKSHLYI